MNCVVTFPCRNKVKEFNERKFKWKSEEMPAGGNQGTALAATLCRSVCNVI
jgi:hypothetical protein